MRFTRANVTSFALPTGKAEAIVFDDATPGFGLRIRSGGKRTWVAQYRIGTKQRRITLGSTTAVDLDEARRRAKAALGKVALGADPQAEKTDARAQASVTLGATAEDYLTRRASKRLKPGSFAEVERHLKKHWRPFAERPLGAVTRALVSARLAEISAENGPFAANRARAALSAMFSWAIGEGFVDDNPVAGTHRPAEEVKRDRVLSNAEVALIWQHAGAGDFGIIVRLLLLTACRREEVGGMAWPELQDTTWTVPAERTKNGRPHELVLPSPAMALLAAQPAREGRDLVFGSRAGPFSGWSKAKTELDARILAALKSRARRQGGAGAVAAARPPANRSDAHGRPRGAAARRRGGAEPHQRVEGRRRRDLQPRGLPG